MRLMLLALTAVMAALPLWAAQLTVVAEADHAKWNAVGQVNYAGFNARSICTGTLIAPDVVLTAVHCTAHVAARPTKDKPLHFIAGWNRGIYAAHRLVAEVARHPAYRADRNGLANVATDIALLRLESPITEVPPLPLGQIGSATPYFAGYRNDRRHAITVYRDCPARYPLPRLLIMGCEAVAGNSGSPVLIDGADGWQVAGVVAAAAPGRAYAALAGDWVHQTLQQWGAAPQ